MSIVVRLLAGSGMVTVNKTVACGESQPITVLWERVTDRCDSRPNHVACRILLRTQGHVCLQASMATTRPSRSHTGTQCSTAFRTKSKADAYMTCEGIQPVAWVKCPAVNNLCGRAETASGDAQPQARTATCAGEYLPFCTVHTSLWIPAYS